MDNPSILLRHMDYFWHNLGFVGCFQLLLSRILLFNRLHFIILIHSILDILDILDILILFRFFVQIMKSRKLLFHTRHTFQLSFINVLERWKSFFLTSLLLAIETSCKATGLSAVYYLITRFGFLFRKLVLERVFN